VTSLPCFLIFPRALQGLRCYKSHSPSTLKSSPSGTNARGVHRDPLALSGWALSALLPHRALPPPSAEAVLGSSCAPSPSTNNLPPTWESTIPQSALSAS
jgi:hypothetical protein